MVKRADKTKRWLKIHNQFERLYSSIFHAGTMTAGGDDPKFKKADLRRKLEIANGLLSDAMERFNDLYYLVKKAVK